MSKHIRFVADVHIGNHKKFGGELKSGINARCQRVIDALTESARAADALVVLGDLFDTSHPSPQIIAATQDALLGGSTTLLMGNHDMVSNAPGDNALVAMRPVVREVIEHPCIDVPAPGVELFMVPFRPEPAVEWFAEVVGDLAANAGAHGKPETRALCFHAGVRDHNTPKFLWGAPDSIDVDLLFEVMRRAKIDTALCGNWHNPRCWRRDGMTVWQVGALVPTGFDNAGWEFGTAVDLDLATHQYRKVSVSGPRFIKTTTAELPTLAVGKGHKPSDVFVSVVLEPGESQEEAEAMVAVRGFGGAAFTTRAEDTQQEEQAAAEGARTADTLDEALRQYVESMPLPESVERAAVHAKVVNYMGRG